MSAELFVKLYKGHALEVEKKSGISAKFIMAQAAHESAWGKSVKHNNFFGIKAGKNWKGERALISTTEILKTPDAKFPVIERVVKLKEGKYKYICKDWFRVYKTPKDSFADHARFFSENKRYREALKVKSNPLRFAEEVAKAGYATDPEYAKKIKAVIDSVERRWGK